MTREEARTALGDRNNLLWGMNKEERKYYSEALDMAISALSEELSEDGTLTVHFSDGSKVKRVFVMGDNIYGGLYYPDSAENKGEFEGMTNGEVIQAVFPYVTAEDTSSDRLIETDLDEYFVLLRKNWWNAPYQKGGEK